jgi:glucuronokinase
LNGYYGGLRLIKATIKRFAEYCQQIDIRLPAENFSLRYSSNIPRQVGLAGSSAIVTAAMRALCRFYNIIIPKEILASLILSVERDELGIGAGLQDRVAQVYEGLTYMDFNQEFMDKHGHGIYESLDPTRAV